MNVIILMGRITSNIELKYTASGSAIANFSIAYNSKYKKADGSFEEKTSFFDVVAFGKRGETINQFFKKGSRILVKGELEQNSWTKEDGTKMSKIVIKLDTFDFIDKKEGAGQGNGYQAPQQQQHDTPQREKPTYGQPTYGQPQAPTQPTVDEDEIPF